MLAGAVGQHSQFPDMGLNGRSKVQESAKLNESNQIEKQGRGGGVGWQESKSLAALRHGCACAENKPHLFITLSKRTTKQRAECSLSHLCGMTFAKFRTLFFFFFFAGIGHRYSALAIRKSYKQFRIKDTD